MWDLEVEGSAAGGGGGGIARRQRPPSHSESLAPGPTVHLKSAASVRLRRLGRWPGPSRRALGRRARALEVECHESSSHRVRVTGTQAGTGAAPGPGPARARRHRRVPAPDAADPAPGPGCSPAECQPDSKGSHSSIMSNDQVGVSGPAAAALTVTVPGLHHDCPAVTVPGPVTQ